MKRIVVLVLLGPLLLSAPVIGHAQTPRINRIDISPTLEATESAEASPSAEATGAARLVERVTEKKPDLTEPEGPVKGKLERLLEAQELGPLGITNSLRYAIRNSVSQGVPTNLVVLLLLFPLVTAIIAASRHLIGLRGFGIFTPAVVAVGFLATGIVMGWLLFAVILVVATMARVLIRRLKLPYLPRTSLMLWFVALAVLGLLLVSPYIGLKGMPELSIFPILLLVLLAETFIDVQVRRNIKQAIEMTFETLLLATISFFVMELETVQEFVLLYPELTIVGVLILNIFIGKFAGLRLLEYWRFKELFV